MVVFFLKCCFVVHFSDTKFQVHGHTLFGKKHVFKKRHQAHQAHQGKNAQLFISKVFVKKLDHPKLVDSPL